MAHSLQCLTDFHPRMDAYQSISGGARESTVVRHDGPYSWRWNVSGSTGYVRYGNQVDNGEWSSGLNRDGWMTFAFQIASFPGAGQYYYLGGFTGYNSTSGDRTVVRVTENKNLEIYNSVDGASWEAGSYTLSANTWYIISIKSTDASSPYHQYVLYADDSGHTVLETKGHSTNSNSAAQYGYVGPYKTSYGDVYFADVIYEWHATGGVDNPMTPLRSLGGAYKINSFFPVSRGTDYTNITSGDYDDYDDWVNEGATDDGDYLTFNNGGYATANVEEPSEDGLYGSYFTMAYVRLKGNPAGQSCGCRLREGGSTWTNSPTSSGMTAWKNYVLPVEHETNDTTILDWEVGGIELGGSYSNNKFMSAAGLSLAYTFEPVIDFIPGQDSAVATIF